MKKFLIFFGFFLLMGFIAGCTKVSTGERAVCKQCGKVIADTVQQITVPSWDAKKYGISILQTYCVQCGSQPIEYKFHYICKHCGNEYRVDVFSAQRREEKSSQTLKGDYCGICANEEILYKITRICKRCGATIGVSQRTALRIKEQKDEQVIEGYCNICKAQAKVEEGAQKVGDWVGGIGAAVGKGIVQGVKRKINEP